LSGINAVKTSLSGAWDEQVYSAQGFTGGAYASARVVGFHSMFGLNTDPLTDASYSSIDYAWYTTSGGALYVYESSSQNAGPFPWVVGDLLEITYTFDGANWNIDYYQNGILRRHVPGVSAGQTFFFDSSYYYIGAPNPGWNDIHFGPTATPTFVQFIASVGVRLSGSYELAQSQSYESEYFVKLEVQNDSGRWIDVGALLGKDWIINTTWGEDRDTQVSQATFVLVMALGINSLAPLMTSSPLNVDSFAAYAPLLQKGRLARSRSATLPRGAVPFSGIAGTWSSSGVTLAGFIAATNDGDVLSAAWHTDTSVPGAFVQVDMGSTVTFDQVRSWLSSSGVAIFKVRGSADGIAWTDIAVGFAPSEPGPNDFYFPSASFRYWRLELTNTPGGGSWVNEVQFNRDWRPAFDGRIDSVQTAHNDLQGLGPVTLLCSDLGAWLMDLQIETEGTQYGDPGTPPPLEDVLQAMTDDNIPVGEPAVAIVKHSPSNFGVTDYRQGETKLLEALINIVLDSVGEDIRYRYDESHVSQLMWFDPDRNRSSVDATFANGKYVMHTLGESIDDIRNSGELAYIEAGVPGVVVAEDAFSVAEYRKRFFRLPFNKGLSTEAEAQAVIDAVVHDLSDSPAEAEVELPFVWWVQLYDRYTFKANNEHYDQDQTFGVGGYRHSIENGIGSTVLTPLTSRIVGAYELWKNKLTIASGLPLVCPAITLSEQIVGGAPRLTLYKLLIAFALPTSPDFDHMEFEVISDTTGDVDASVLSVTASPAAIPVQPGVTYTVTPFVVAKDGTRTAGTPQGLLISNTLHVGPTRLVLPVGTDLWAT
jgi:hypothetical protein